MTDWLEWVLEDLEEEPEAEELLELPEAAALPRPAGWEGPGEEGSGASTGGEDSGAPSSGPASVGQEAGRASGEAKNGSEPESPGRAGTERVHAGEPGRRSGGAEDLPIAVPGAGGAEDLLEWEKAPAAGTGGEAVRRLRGAVPAGEEGERSPEAVSLPAVGRRGVLPAGGVSGGSLERTAAEGAEALPGSELPSGALEAAAGRGTAGTLYAQVRRTRAAAEYAAARRETVTVPVPAAAPAPAPLEAEGLDRLFQRDARRYDGGFTLY